jgi:hypothetical protein
MVVILRVIGDAAALASSAGRAALDVFAAQRRPFPHRQGICELVLRLAGENPTWG